MNKTGFKFVCEGKEVSIVRTKPSEKKHAEYQVQRMKVMCFDSARIDRIFTIQENAVKVEKR